MIDLTILSQFPASKTEQKDFVAMMVAKVEEGDIDPLKVEANVSNIEAIAKEYRKNERVKAILLDEVRKYHRGRAEVYNAVFEEREVGVKYDFSKCGHKRYNEIVEMIAELTEEKKELENEMKIHKDVYVYTDMTTGESYEVTPPMRTSTLQVVTTIKK